jgi:hypothetical protein
MGRQQKGPVTFSGRSRTAGRLLIGTLGLLLLAVTLIWQNAAIGEVVRVKTSATAHLPLSRPPHTANFQTCIVAEPHSAAASAGTNCGSEISVSAIAQLDPRRLPQTEAAPAVLRIGFTSKAADGSTPELSRIELDVSHNVELHTVGLPSCSFAELYSTVTNPAHSCAKSLIGRGIDDSEIALPGKAPVAVNGHLTAFYVKRKEGAFVLARVRTGPPLPLIYVIPFKVVKESGAFGTSLTARRMWDIHGICTKPNCFSPYTLKGIYSRISKFEISLHRHFRRRSEKDSFLNARCPEEALFSLAGISLSYGGPVMTGTVLRKCRIDRAAGTSIPDLG